MKIYGAIRTVIYWALTALVLVFAAVIAEIDVLRYFIGGLMIFYGVEEIVLTVFKNKKHYSINCLYWNIIEIIIGLTLIIFVGSDYEIVCVSWAIWSILRETRELVEATGELKTQPVPCKIVAIFNILESLTVIALSLTMVIEPGEYHAKIHLYLLAAELFTKVAFPLINYIALRFMRRKKEEDTATEQPEIEEAAEEIAAAQEEIHNSDIAEEEPIV